RHDVVGVGRGDAADDFALGTFAGHDSGLVRFAAAECVGLVVQPQLAFLLVRSVALDAALDEDGSDVAAKINVTTRGGRSGGQASRRSARCECEHELQKNAAQTKR